MDNSNLEYMDCENDRGVNSLPNELLLDIWEYLPNSDLLQMRLVCKRWQYVTYFPKFVKKLKLQINTNNLTSICEILANDKNAVKRLAYEVLELRELMPSDNLRQVLNSLGPYVRNLSVYNSQVFSILNDCFPALEVLHIGEIRDLEGDNFFALDLSKFKHIKSLHIVRGELPHDAITHLLSSVINDVSLKMEQLSLVITDHRDYEKLVVQAVRRHSHSLNHLELDLRIRLNLISEWNEIFPLLTKLETLKITGDPYSWLPNLIFGLPKEAPLKQFNIHGGWYGDDDLLRLIVGKWHRCVENLNLNYWAGMADDGMQHLRLCRRLKVLSITRCTTIAVDRLLKSLTAEVTRTLKPVKCDEKDKDQNQVKRSVERFPELTSLSLENYYTTIDDYILQYIFQHQRSLQSLSLKDCRDISDDGLIGFGSTPAPLSNLKGLQALTVRGCRDITDRGLAEAFKFNELRTLALEHADKITAVGIKEIVKNCPTLESVAVVSCGLLDDEAILHFAQGLNRLKYISISNCALITPTSVDNLAKYGKALKMLHICRVDPLVRPSFKEKLDKLADINITVVPATEFLDEAEIAKRQKLERPRTNIIHLGSV